MTLSDVIGCVFKRAESPEPSCVRGEARRLDRPRPQGRPSSEANPAFAPPGRRGRAGDTLLIPAPSAAGG